MIILASASPRRRELLKMLGLEFEIRPSEAEENVPEGLSPEETVMYLAKLKADSVPGEVKKDDIIISADTIVVLEGEIFGKPSGAGEAEEMLEKLSGKTHAVYTGICVNGIQGYEKSLVTFKKLENREIRAYIQTGEPLDKAGAYGIQGKGALFIERIEGDYFNIVGLPLCRLGKMLKSVGVTVI